MPAQEMLSWVRGSGGDCIPSVGVLAVRILRYALDGVAPGPQALSGLRVRLRGHGTAPIWHQSSGLYGFVRLPPGPVTIEVQDPSRRYLPSVVSATVPDRGAVRDALAQCRRPVPGSAGPSIVDLALRPAPEMSLPPGSTALWGLVSANGTGIAVPGAQLSLDTEFDGVARTATTLSGPDGSYLLVLPGEVLDRAVSPPVREFQRNLRVFAPRPPLAAALALDFVAGLPADLFSMNAGGAGSPWRQRRFRLRAGDGVLRPRIGGQDPPTTVSIGQCVRWDIELLA